MNIFNDFLEYVKTFWRTNISIQIIAPYINIMLKYLLFLKKLP